MKARHIVLMGLAVLAAACSSSTPATTPSTSTTVSPASTSTTVSPTSTSTTTYQANRKPPPVPHCYYTGSGYGTCEGYVIPGPGSVTLLTYPDKDGIFHLKGPAPLQTKTIGRLWGRGLRLQPSRLGHLLRQRRSRCRRRYLQVEHDGL